MYFRIIATLVLSFVFYIGSSQISYHRLYETTLNDPIGMNDTIFYHMASTTNSGDVFAMGTKRIGDIDLSVIFTKHSVKGDIDWSKELDLGQDTVEITSIGNFKFNGELDSILFVMEVEINGQRTELFGRLDKSGNQLDLRTVGGIQVSTQNNIPNTAPFVNQSDILLSPGLLPTLSRVGLGDSLFWSRTYDFLDDADDSKLSVITDLSSTPDTTILLTGVGDGLDIEFVVSELDSNGVQIWAELYAFSENNLSNIRPREIKALGNGNFAMVGSFLTDPGSARSGFVLTIDTLGSILTAKKFRINEASTTVSNLVEGADGTLWMSGTYTIADSIKYFTTNMDLAGEVNWTTIYGEQLGIADDYNTSLLNVQATGGATLVGHGFIDDLQVLQVMKHDAMGNAMCSDTITVLAEDLIVTADTLTTSVENGGIFFDSLDFELEPFLGFRPPTLSITQYPPFCPNELIDTFLVASVNAVAEENISYMWSTGEITDTINVIVQPMMMGEYSVTVTITEDVCYMMCDTVQITRLTLPEVTISQDNSQFCEERIVLLNTTYIPGATGETYLWNTMETIPSIVVDEGGLYSVTVTDACGEIAVDNFEMTLPTFDPSVFFGASVENFCETGTAIVNAIYTGGGNIPVFMWSDGQEGSSIVVSTPGTYSVTVTDECGLTASSEDVVEFPNIATEADIGFMEDCDLQKIIFNNGGNDDVTLAVYLIDEDGGLTLLTNPANSFDLGNHIIYALDACSNTIDSLSLNSTAICGGLLTYPIAFFPGGLDENSQKFGPIPNDTMNVENLVSNVEFKVFNRWGETVFESNDILDAWDGSHKGEPAPSEVYIWYVSYIVEGVEMLDKGDVTLIR